MGSIHEEGMTAEEFWRFSVRRGPSRYIRSVCERFLSRAFPYAMLEVGCGAAVSVAYAAASRQGAVRIVGCDIDRELLGFAARTVGEAPDVELVCNRPDALPFADQSFDLVFSESVLHHFDDPRAMLAEMWRVLKPGGNLIVVDLNPRSPVAAIYLLYARLKRVLGIATPQDNALTQSLHQAFTEADALRIFGSLGIHCLRTKALLCVCFEARKS